LDQELLRALVSCYGKASAPSYDLHPFDPAASTKRHHREANMTDATTHIEHAADHLSDAASETGDAVKQEAKTVSAKADELSKAAAESAAAARDWAAERAAIAREWALDQSDVLRDNVQSKPFIAVGVSAASAFAAGLVLGVLLSSRR